MNVFAIGDLHLPGGEEKPMSVFGPHWEGHWQKIAADWTQRVTPEDVVLIPGDISWAMQLEKALPDLRAIGVLPGRKVLLKGNHDFWWSAVSRVRAALPEGMYALQNDALALGPFVFCGSRGWSQPQGDDTSEDKKIYDRELLRLELSLGQAKRLRSEGQCVIALTHFPPLPVTGEETPVSLLLEQYGVQHVVYGHLHGPAAATAFEGVARGVDYHFTACDGIGFRLLQLKTER